LVIAPEIQLRRGEDSLLLAKLGRSVLRPYEERAPESNQLMARADEI
jgi:hypothetical protein